MKPFSLLIKPASADCNLHCSYCFYLNRGELCGGSASHRMSDEMLEQLISSYMATKQPQHTFCWQGGEPTLMGLDFFQQATKLQQKHARAGCRIANGLQTNATLIDDALASHFAAYSYLLGVSLDGPADVHDAYRKSIDGRGSHAEVIRGIDCLNRHGVEFNILTLVSSANVSRGAEVYQYLRDHKLVYQQYIPCVEFDENGSPQPWTITPQQWGDFLCEVFDAWGASDTRAVSVRLFDSILELMLNGTRNVCHMADNCCQYLLVEHNGDVYPCDFFVNSKHKIGNITTHSWTDMLESDSYLEFGRRKIDFANRCDSCGYMEFCAGDCLKHRIGKSSWLCGGWRLFYDHAMPKLQALASEVIQERTLEQDAENMLSNKPGRNEPCPCGSGKKFKKCHG